MIGRKLIMTLDFLDFLRIFYCDVLKKKAIMPDNKLNFYKCFKKNDKNLTVEIGEI